MSKFFKNFPVVDYRFGDNTNTNRFNNLSVYVDVIDQVKDNASFFAKYSILENERPDQLSNKLYGNPSYHWTFFLLNDHIRESGWPVSNLEVVSLAKKYYPYRTITTKTSIASTLTPGKTIEGTTSGSIGTIISRNLDLGQIVVDAESAFSNGEAIFNADNVTETAVVYSNTLQYLSIHHYENSDGEWVDIDPALQTTGSLTAVTRLDRLRDRNDDLKLIKILKPTALTSVVSEFRRLLVS